MGWNLQRKRPHSSFFVFKKYSGLCQTYQKHRLEGTGQEYFAFRHWMDTSDRETLAFQIQSHWSQSEIRHLIENTSFQNLTCFIQIRGFWKGLHSCLVCFHVSFYWLNSHTGKDVLKVKGTRHTSSLTLGQLPDFPAWGLASRAARGAQAPAGAESCRCGVGLTAEACSRRVLQVEFNIT